MANYLDTLLSKIEDGNLKAALAAEVQSLRDAKKFGLVFERHIPERVRLLNHPVTPGVFVTRRKQQTQERWLVKSIVADTATLERMDGEELFETEMPVQELVVVRDFGEAIYPGLKSVDSIIKNPEKPTNVAIAAENFHALETLLYTCENSLDCIYVDPPYNTGARDWKYNNDFVDNNDLYRHSKWLSFMEKRLRLSKRLLKQDSGVLIVTIDENEYSRLSLLLEEIFPAPQFQQHTVSCVINPRGTPKQNFSYIDEKIIFVVPDIGQDVILPRPKSEEADEKVPTWLIQVLNKLAEASEVSDAEKPNFLTKTQFEKLSSVLGWSDDEEVLAQGEDFEVWGLMRGGAETSKRNQRPNQFYAIYVDPETNEAKSLGPALRLTDAWEPHSNAEGHVAVYPLGAKKDAQGNFEEKVWRYGRDTMLNEIESGNVVVGKKNKNSGMYSMGIKKPKKETKKETTVWTGARYDASAHGTKLVDELLGGTGRFSYPKSLYSVADAIGAVVRNRPNAVVLDFFAGSGTTAHAVAYLNKMDDGNRRSIVVTNNEVEDKIATPLLQRGLFPGDAEFEQHGIFWNATMPRIKAAIQGVSATGQTLSGSYIDGFARADGFDENVEFFELTYQDRNQIGRGKAFEAVSPLLWLKAGARGQRVDKVEKSAKWLMPKGGCYAVLFDPQVWRQFMEALEPEQNVQHVFIVTNALSIFQQVASELPVGVDSTMLYEDYISTFEINTGGGRK